MAELKRPGSHGIGLFAIKDLARGGVDQDENIHVFFTWCQGTDGGIAGKEPATPHTLLA
jgi:hypothetical protein